jgi:Prealbumin-like fold domain
MTAVRKELSRRRKPLWFATAFVALAAVLVFAFAASAILPGSTFEGNDGNFTPTGTNTDWTNVHGGVVTGVDLPTGQTDNSFANGTKESDVNVTVGTGSIPNSKADLGNFYVASEQVGTQFFMYLGWTRVNTSGTTNFDFEINQAAQPDLTTPGPKLLVRTTGDIIITYDFQGGAQTPTLGFRTWQANGTWSASTPITSPNGESEVNRVSLPNPLAESPSPAIAPAFTFGEAAINLTALGLVPPGECSPFSSAYVKSRASDAFTSALKDFIAPESISLDTCGTIIVEKVTVPSPDPTDTSFNFEADYTADFALKNGESKTVGDLNPDTYSVAETVPANWELTSATCSDGSDPAAIALGPSETVTCTFTNTLQLGAIKVTKTAKHAAAEGGTILQSGVDFTVNGVTDTTDANGEACFDGLTFGSYDVTETVPAGYHAEGPTTKAVVVDNAASCSDDPYGGESVSFTNIPLTDITLSVDSQVDGGTASTMDCEGETGSTDADGDGSVTKTDLEPGTYTCTVVIDP